MRINNKLIAESFEFTPKKIDMSLRIDEIENLSDIDNYCKEIYENMVYDDTIWDIEVERGICLADWLYSNMGAGSQDERRFLGEILSKQGIQEKENKDINISLGEWDGAVDTDVKYIKNRREILSSIDTPEEYFEFMKSCFIDSYFADNVLNEMKNIQNFPQHVKEITDNLAVLNDEAIILYYKYKNNLRLAVDILSSKLLACSMDPRHRDSLWFSFTYEDVHTDIRCEPHMKLIREDSDLRIYFYWKDERIADGSKVLIGRIGRHPWKK